MNHNCLLIVVGGDVQLVYRGKFYSPSVLENHEVKIVEHSAGGIRIQVDEIEQALRDDTKNRGIHETAIHPTAAPVAQHAHPPGRPPDV